MTDDLDEAAARRREAPRAYAIPRWALALLALGLLAGAILLMAWLKALDPQGRIVGNPSQIGPSEPERALPEPARPMGPLTRLAEILEAPDDAALQGRTALLDGAQVQAVAGDTTFWIGPNPSERLPVVLRGELTGRQPEAQVTVRAGQRLRLFGIIRRLDELERLHEGERLSADEKRALRAQPIYLSAERVEVLRGEPERP